MNQAALHRMLAAADLKNPKAADQEVLFKLRFDTNITLIQQLFFKLYPKEIYESSFGKLLKLLPELFSKRSEELRLTDLERMAMGNWYQSEKMVGMQLYVDRYNKNLRGLEEKLPYLENLGVNMLHLMPITTRPAGPNDGGYAVSSYTQVDKKFGTKKDLLDLIRAMHGKDMYIMFDFVVNHTSDEFPWAKKAAAGNKKYQNYYYTFSNREIPDEFEKTMPEIFPEAAPGNFTYNEEMQKWVMTVFNHYQWDLNYSNPEVFMEMLKNLVALANMGVDLVRFDALAFLWKKMGTNSQNLPEAHTLISLFRLCLQTIAPGVIILAEAIVAPLEIMKYFGQGHMEGNECELAYNATLMALIWNSIATKKTLLLNKSLQNLPSKPSDSSWINYVRCHDDIGLGFEDRYIYEVGWDAREHRRFLLNYFSRKLEWSPAAGQLFMYNPKNGDGRITGSTASLLGLETGIDLKDSAMVAEAIEKIILVHGIILSYGGIPMIYAGDELGTLNDYSYLNDESTRYDSRWLNRPQHRWELVEALDNQTSIPSRIFRRLRHMISLRKANPVLADHSDRVLYDAGNSHVLVYERQASSGQNILVICNFDESVQAVEISWIRKLGYVQKSTLYDIISGQEIKLKSGLLSLDPFKVLWLQAY